MRRIREGVRSERSAEDALYPFVSRGGLRYHRQQGRPLLPFHQFGTRMVWYRDEDIAVLRRRFERQFEEHEPVRLGG